MPIGDPITVLFPDLLQPVPLVRVDGEHTALGIQLAFAGGTSGGLFADALDRSPLPPSTWAPEAFASDLFLKQFVSLCFGIRLGAHAPVMSTTHLVKVLSHPPSDPAIVHYRRGIIGELAGTPELRTQLERLYVNLCHFRTLLEGTTGTGKWDANRRQLDILTLIKTIVADMAAGFGSANSGLSKLSAFGQRVQASEAYQSLTDLLRYDERLAALDLKLVIGADGRIRGFELLSVQENSDNPFVASPWRRWLGKLELFARGFKFGDGEIMARLLDAVFEGLRGELLAFVPLLGDVEFYLGALSFWDRARAAGLAVCLPELTEAHESRQLLGLFNPLLLAHGVPPIPCNIETDQHATTVLITGPNSGGKTRLLQSLALTQLLAQSGLFIPAASGRVALVPSLVVSLIEEAKSDQSEGRLGTELIRIRGLFERLPPGAMVILDELCSGTNPSEGEEIFELVVRMLTHLRPQAFITTHFLGFAARLERERKIPGLRFLQVALGANQEPTYQFEAGVAQTSLAAHAAARLGVTGEQLLALIQHNISSASTRGN